MRKVFERYLTVQEERRLLGHVAKFGDVLARRDHAWMRCLRHTGVRIEAFSRLSVQEARQALKTDYLALRPEIQKGGHPHRIFLVRKARDALRALLRIRTEMGYPEQPDAPLVMSRNHRPLAVRSYQSRLRHWVQSAGLDVQASPHWFRHTLAKRIVAQSTAREPLRVVQAVLGHKSRNTTAIYTWPDREEIEQAMEEAS